MYMFFVFNKRKIGKNWDVILGTSGVIFTALLAWGGAKIYKTTFVLEIRDISYKQLQATGHSANSLAVKGMKALELFLCRKAKSVIVVTNGFKNVLQKDGIDPQKIFVISNGVDITEENTKRELENKFVLSYFGTLGLSQNIIGTFDYAQKIKKHCDNFEYLLIGEGAQKNRIEEHIRLQKYDFIRQFSGMSSQELEKYYKLTELSVITLQKTDDFKYTIPSKLFQVMGRGIAVMYIGPAGEAADIINNYQAGLTLTGTLEEDLKTLDDFFSDRDWNRKIQIMGQNGKKTVKEHYSRRKLAKDYMEIMEQVRE